MISLQRCREYISFNHILYLLLFLYPLFATVVRHWNSTIFILIMLLALVYFFTQRKKDNIVLHKYEKVFLWLLAGNFFVFLLTSLINLPEDTREIRLDIEARFLLIIPLYFLLVKAEDGFKWLAYGAIISVFIALGYYINDIVFKGQETFSGIYSRLYTAPMLLIYTIIGGCFLVSVNVEDRALKWILAAAVIITALFTIYNTHSRATYFSILAVSMLSAGLLAKRWWKLVSIMAIMAILLTASLYLENVRTRLSAAYTDLSEYIALNDPEERLNVSLDTSSVGTRLEMWRIAPLTLRDHAFFGVGNGNYEKALKVYVDNKQLNRVVILNSHAHNVFVNVLIVKGLIGLLITCLVVFYPLYVYTKTYHYSKGSAVLGILFVTIIFLVSMNETAPFVKSNFVATYLLLSLVIFHNHMKHIRRKLNG